jgi:hypothetical protein
MKLLTACYLYAWNGLVGGPLTWVFHAFMLPVCVPVTVSVTDGSDGVAVRLRAVVPDMKEPPGRVLDVPVAQARSLS